MPTGSRVSGLQHEGPPDIVAATEPNHCASARAATGPTCRTLSATMKRQRSFVFAFSSSASSVNACADGCGPVMPSFFSAGDGLRRNGARRTGIPVFSRISVTKVPPTRLIRLLVIEVATISRRSLCPTILGLSLVWIGVGK